MMSTRVLADFAIHGLASLVLFPNPYSGRGTKVCWDIEEKHDFSLASRNGKICWVGPADKFSDNIKLTSDAEVMNGNGLSGIPGFVDSHTHLVYAGDRSGEFELRVQGKKYLDILASGGGILKTVSCIRSLSEDEIFFESRERVWRMIETGVTTLEIKSGYGLDLENEMKMLRVIKRLGDELPIRVVPTFMGAHAVPVEYKERPDAFVKLICENWIPKVAESKLARFNDVFTENKAFNVDQSRAILEAGRKNGLIPKIHADEVNAIGGIDLAIEVGAISADHLLKTTSDGISKLVGSGVVPTLLPGTSTFLLETHHAPARAMIDAGLPVAIASDFNPGSCQFSSANLIQTLAMLQLKMSAAETLMAATLHAAHALMLGNETGSIEIGKNMDIVLLEASSYKQIGYRAGENLVHAVISKGIPVFSI
ncbi:MAG: imidazolonepropionase [Candidatus Riflebacteria bacterium]|nr:imidazolonepropionase [Candidatus Riflebacteria bacterium]